MLERLREVLGFDVRELAGGHVAGEIPLTADLINRVIAGRLSASRAPISSVTIEPGEDGAFSARVRLSVPLVPPFTIQAALAEQPRFPDSPVLVLRWSVAGLGPFGTLAGAAVALLGKLPPGIRVDGDRVSIDLADVLRAQGGEDVLPLLRELRVSTGEGRVVVRFDARV